MKRIAIALVIVVFAATSLFAGGKACQLAAGKNVSLTGTLQKSGSGDDAKTVFRVANSNASYTVCHKTKSSLLSLGDSGATLQVTGKLVSCEDGQSLVIESAKKI